MLAGGLPAPTQLVLALSYVLLLLLQVEFYFSDANLPTDKHLLKQISKDPEGYGETPAAAAWGTGGRLLCRTTAVNLADDWSPARPPAADARTPKSSTVHVCSTVCRRVCCLSCSTHTHTQQHTPTPHTTAVPLKMIANFKRVKGLTKELCVVTEALKGSSMLSVDEEGSRVRRTTPLPTYDTDDICKRTVVAEHLPDKPTIRECGQRLAAGAPAHQLLDLWHLSRAV